MNDQHLLKARVDAIQEALRALAERLSRIDKTYQEMPLEVKAQLGLDTKALDLASWTPFKNGEGAWVFSNSIPDLKEALLAADVATLEVGSFRYTLKGDNDKFIVRHPA